MLELPTKTQSTGRVVVDWQSVVVGFKLTIDTYIINVLNNEMVEKIAKTSGKKRKERRLTVQLNGFQETYECGTESIKKGSFLKNLIKKSITKIIETIGKPSNYLPIATDKVRLVNFLGYLEQPQWSMINREFGEAFTLKEIKNVYKKYAKHLHPDMNKNVVENEFKILKGLYEYFKEQRIMMVDIVREHGVDMEY